MNVSVRLSTDCIPCNTKMESLPQPKLSIPIKSTRHCSSTVNYSSQESPCLASESNIGLLASTATAANSYATTSLEVMDHSSSHVSSKMTPYAIGSPLNTDDFKILAPLPSQKQTQCLPSRLSILQCTHLPDSS
ncbi:hypothetical protein K7432_009275 [Basidiobolus ranarum]|uniref:Uncharacterized protein n=1 Tax=Basidiobolus ranarum TaxID=34480 RepID=A0ABR2WQR0_9FUNG